MKRRDFLAATSAVAGGVAASGTAAARQGTSSGGGNTTGGNATGVGGNQTGGNQTGGKGNATSGSSGGGNTKTVKVGTQGNGGYFAFSPEELTVAPGTTVVWKWTGKGGGHNVVADDGAFDSGSPVTDAGTTFEHTFSETGEFPYHCVPHKSLGMVGTIIVQEGGASAAASGGGGATEPEPEEMGVPLQAHFVGIATILMMVVSLAYTFFVVKYGESPNAKRGT